jgi:hypothetical protein
LTGLINAMIPTDEGFEKVEFFDMTGQTVAVVTLRGSDIRQPLPSDRPSVRPLSHAE